MRKLIFGILGLLWLLAPPLAGLTPAQAQQVNLYCYQGPTNPQWAPCASGNPLSVNATVSASITGFPGTTQTTGTPIAVTAGGVTGTLPSGTEVVASNVGTTNNAYCKLGASATTSDQLIAPNSWFGFTVGSNSQLTCITSTSTTTVNMVGGSGLPTGAGGGGGGGGGSSGAVFGPTAAGSAAANPPVLMGGTIDGTAIGNVDNVKVAGGLLFVQGSSGTFPATQSGTWTDTVTQATASNLLAQVSNNGTFAVQATLQAAATTAIGKVDPNTIGLWGLAASTQNGTTPTNGGLVMGQFNTTPTTITTGNISPLQMDASGNLLVNIKAGAGSGGTAIADGSTFTIGTTSETPAACTFVTGGITITTGKSSILTCTAAGSLHTTVDNSTTALPNNVDTVAVQTGAANSPVNSYGYLFNGTTFDRSRSGTTTGSTLINGAGTAGTASGGVVTVQGQASMIPVAISAPLNTTPTDCSGTITTGGTAQNAFSAQAALHGFTIMNLSIDPVWISFTTTAAVGATQSYLLAAGSSTVQGGSYSTPFGFGMNTALSLIAATTSDKFSCTRW